MRSPARQLLDRTGTLVQSYSGTDLQRDARALFPERDGEWNTCEGSTHLVMSQLADIAREAIAFDHITSLQRVFGLLSSAVERPNVDPEVPNAIQISFIEPADFAGKGDLLELVPETVRSLIFSTPPDLSS